METKTYLIKADGKTIGHCGHIIREGDDYYMIRTDAIRWLTLCSTCVSSLQNPAKTTLSNLVLYYFETCPPDHNASNRFQKTSRSRSNSRSEVIKKRKREADEVIKRKLKEEALKEIDWI